MPKSRNQEQELEVLFRARYPLVYLVSWEEDRAQDMLARLAEKQGKRLFVWTATEGMTSQGSAAADGSQAPLAALEFISKVQEASIFVLKDIHAFLQDPKVVRGLRDLVPKLKTSYKNVLLLSPVLNLPVEIEKDVTVVDYDLPGPDEMRALVDEIIESSKSGKFQVALSPEEKEKMIQAALGMTLAEAESAFARAIVLDSKLSIDALDIILEETKQIIRKSRLLEYYEAREDVSVIGGLDLLKDWLQKRGQAFSEKARQFGLPEPKGVLLLGVQGCGKSLTCKAIASLWKLPLLRLDMGTLFNGLMGQSEDNMRRAIKTAESVAPCILWLDEIEKGMAGTQSSNFSDAGTTARVFSTFLTWLQEKTKPVFVAATANDIKMLPPELLRKGRLDEIFFIDLPNQEERKDIFAIHLKKKGRVPGRFDLEALAWKAAGFSGAEIEQAVASALYDAFSRSQDIAQEDVMRAIGSTVPLSETMREDIDSLRRWASTRARPSSPQPANHMNAMPAAVLEEPGREPRSV